MVCDRYLKLMICLGTIFAFWIHLDGIFGMHIFMKRVGELCTRLTGSSLLLLYKAEQVRREYFPNIVGRDIILLFPIVN